MVLIRPVKHRLLCISFPSSARPSHLGKCAWPVPTTVHENGASLRRAAYTLIIAVSGQRLFDFWRLEGPFGKLAGRLSLQ
jgi:hypothetical protein